MGCQERGADPGGAEGAAGIGGAEEGGGGKVARRERGGLKEWWWPWLMCPGAHVHAMRR